MLSPKPPSLDDPIDPGSLTVLVVGATAGIGKAVSRRLVGLGARVILTGRRRERLSELQDELGDRCHVVELDVRDASSVSALPSGLPEEFRDINLVVASAGIGIGFEVAQQAELAAWHAMVETNVTGLMNVVHAVLPGMVARGDGHIVVLGSMAGDYPYPGGNVYGATKAFAKHLCLNLRADLFGTGLRVTSLEPGLVETEFVQNRARGDETAAQRILSSTVPLTAEDVSESVVFCSLLPRRANVTRLQIMPTLQTFGPLVAGRPEPVPRS